MSTKHTPGPWEVVAGHPKNACVKIVAVNLACGLDEVATLYGFGDDCQRDEAGNWGAQPIRDADARLIAAAPDLLRELQNAVILLVASGAADAPGTTIEAARAAIARATGEA
jgi:hypothetical protein